MEENNNEQTTEKDDSIMGWVIIGATALFSYKIGKWAGKTASALLAEESYKKGVCDTFRALVFKG